MPRKGTSTPAIDRMEGKYVIDIATGCWTWTASRSSQGKYPTIGGESSTVPQYAYRVSWESVNGPVPTTPCPDGSHRWELHHTCSNRLCVNPQHIELVTHREHTREHVEMRRMSRLIAQAQQSLPAAA